LRDPNLNPYGSFAFDFAHLDRVGITRRQEDLRFLAEAKPTAV